MQWNNFVNTRIVAVILLLLSPFFLCIILLWNHLVSSPSACPKWTFGAGCSGECQCVQQNTLECHRRHGTCVCKSGYQGNTCKEGEHTVTMLCSSIDRTHIYSRLCSALRWYYCTITVWITDDGFYKKLFEQVCTKVYAKTQQGNNKTQVKTPSLILYTPVGKRNRRKNKVCQSSEYMAMNANICCSPVSIQAEI